MIDPDEKAPPIDVKRKLGGSRLVYNRETKAIEEVKNVPAQPQLWEIVRDAITAIDSGEYKGVHIKCFNKEEAEEATALVPEQYKDRIQITWLNFTR